MVKLRKIKYQVGYGEDGDYLKVQKNINRWKKAGKSKEYMIMRHLRIGCNLGKRCPSCRIGADRTKPKGKGKGRNRIHQDIESMDS